MSQNINITRIKAVHNALEDLKNQVVFVGGATVSLYADRTAAEARPTDDVDVIVEIATYDEFSSLEKQLRTKGFKNDTSAKFVGRYLLPGIIIDIMPTDEALLGFSNSWYKDGFKTAINYVIDERHEVKIFTSPYFIASKLEAFNSRGGNDGRTSRDFEDIVYILENRKSIWEDMQDSPTSVRSYLKKEFTMLYKNKYIEEWIDAHASYAYNSRTSYIIEEIKNFVNY
ncbi:MAG: nucleotidyl transferase AbiEii/AbiGii toxin family protein [Chitinophagaceae bacterium]|nr:nucleotidyl transferase AbiEii/AbiGii toxin family protein [Chitinophagaceae bacterium]